MFSCFKFRKQGTSNRGESSQPEIPDPLLWQKELCSHSIGEFSIGIVQANQYLEDQVLVDTWKNALFVGVFDGHGGDVAAHFVADNLLLHLIRFVKERGGTICEDIITRAFMATDDGYFTHARNTRDANPTISANGSCCLVGIFWDGMLYVANAGDSRAIVAFSSGPNKFITEQLTQEHNAKYEDIRREMFQLHPDDSQIVIYKNGAWRVKGIAQVTRSIGDLYLKSHEFAMGPSYPRFHLAEPLSKAALSAEPTILTRPLKPEDRFFIFASDGLWEQLSNEEAAELVFNNPRQGIAKRLVMQAIEVAARKRATDYSNLKTIQPGSRRHFHDDISVVVVFVDHELVDRLPNQSTRAVSIRGFVNNEWPSLFSLLENETEDVRTGISIEGAGSSS
ncbi:hypothetical protein AMTRI_Chr02g255840 [Amborella trichopoda]|nr:probable protein phosphatase 2C 43 [Amborella trichopoda]|eukprot:XP_020528389.1 probable protein phosphatase 2C 43 [Amborella trichopoda]